MDDADRMNQLFRTLTNGNVRKTVVSFAKSYSGIHFEARCIEFLTVRR